MERKRVKRLYSLLDRMDREGDTESVAALRWAIFELERMLKEIVS